MKKYIASAGIAIVVGSGIGGVVVLTGGRGVGASPQFGSGTAHPPSLGDISPGIVNALDHLPSQASMESALETQGVSVQVNGYKLGLAGLAARTRGYLNNDIVAAGTAAINRGADVSTAIGQASALAPALRQAVAFGVLTRLLYDTAVANHGMASRQSAERYAQNNYDIYLQSVNDPSPYVAKPPQLTRSDFFSNAAISSYQYTMTVNSEMSTIANADSAAGAGSGVSGSIQVNDTPALQVWMTGQMVLRSVRIHGVPDATASNLASFLPQHLHG
ncbi:MAG: hypothetical protein M0013_06110 [Actinomycetota bacterium]|nr:hypothetical protein [Actinomycetota bacterium]